MAQLGSTSGRRIAIQAARSTTGLWSVEATDPATGATSTHRDIGPDSRIGRALEALTRSIPAVLNTETAPTRSTTRRRA